jgi:hypothetical protein
MPVKQAVPKVLGTRDKGGTHLHSFVVRCRMTMASCCSTCMTFGDSLRTTASVSPSSSSMSGRRSTSRMMSLAPSALTIRLKPPCNLCGCHM